MVLITDVYRNPPGKLAGPIWTSYVHDSYGLYVVAGPEESGKTTFLNRVAAEAAEFMDIPSEQVAFLRFGDQNDGNVFNPLWVNNPPHQANYSREEYERLSLEWISYVVDEINASDIRMVVIDELESSPRAVSSLAAALYLQNRIVFTSETVETREMVIPDFEERFITPDGRSRQVISPIDYAYCYKTFEQDVEGNRTVEGQTIYGHDHASLPLNFALL